jgi:hypothetical protein
MHWVGSSQITPCQVLNESFFLSSSRVACKLSQLQRSQVNSLVVDALVCCHSPPCTVFHWELDCLLYSRRLLLLPVDSSIRDFHQSRRARTPISYGTAGSNCATVFSTFDMTSEAIGQSPRASKIKKTIQTLQKSRCKKTILCSVCRSLQTPCTVLNCALLDL